MATTTTNTTVTDVIEFISTKLCRPNAQGLYGRRSAARLAVLYTYELEVVTDQADTIATGILPDLEMDFNMKLSMRLFPTNCSNAAPSLLLNNSDLDGVVGLSTRGQDTISNDQICEDFVTAGSRSIGNTAPSSSGSEDDSVVPNTTCVIVDGKLIVFFENQVVKNRLDWSGTILRQLTNQMANDKFLSAK